MKLKQLGEITANLRDKILIILILHKSVLELLYCRQPQEGVQVVTQRVCVCVCVSSINCLTWSLASRSHSLFLPSSSSSSLFALMSCRCCWEILYIRINEISNSPRTTSESLTLPSLVCRTDVNREGTSVTFSLNYIWKDCFFYKRQATLFEKKFKVVTR